MGSGRPRRAGGGRPSDGRSLSLAAIVVLLSVKALPVPLSGQPLVPGGSFAWPEGKRFALSLTFDDARRSQVEGGTEFLDALGVKATFYVIPAAVEARLEGWKKAVAGGHEIGNHSLNHPCSGNFTFARAKAVEDMSLETMRDELLAANRRLFELLGVESRSFAYPCGQTFVGRSHDTRSTVPLVASLFATGRGFKDEAANDPAFCDLAQLTGVDMDAQTFEALKPMVDQAAAEGRWLILAGHEMAEAGAQATRFSMLDALIRYARVPANGAWLAPVGEVARHVESRRRP